MQTRIPPTMEQRRVLPFARSFGSGNYTHDWHDSGGPHLCGEGGGDEAQPATKPMSAKAIIPASQPMPAAAWLGVFFDGPQADHNRDGDEIPAWFVYVGDEDADPVGRVYTCHDYHAADQLARKMARERHLELIHEATPA